MGKKVKIVSADPILAKNFKYERRTKNKLDEKVKNEQEKIEENKRRKERMEVEELAELVDKGSFGCYFHFLVQRWNDFF